jgi:DnaJ-class molecular chaperone
MEVRLAPEKYGMMYCPDCDGQGRICSPDDVKVCQHCGGFGFVREERETYAASKMDPFLTQRL